MLAHEAKLLSCSPHAGGFHLISPAACTNHHTRGACGEALSNLVGSITAENTGVTGLKGHARKHGTHSSRSTYITERKQTVKYQSSSVRTQVSPTWLFTVSRPCSARPEARGSLPCCPHSQGADVWKLPLTALTVENTPQWGAGLSSLPSQKPSSS